MIISHKIDFTSLGDPLLTVRYAPVPKNWIRLIGQIVELPVEHVFLNCFVKKAWLPESGDYCELTYEIRGPAQQEMN